MTREPTEAEKRAWEAAREFLKDWAGAGLSDSVDGRYDSVCLEIEENESLCTWPLMEIVRAVIRSLREPTGEMLLAVRSSTKRQSFVVPLLAYQSMIDGASPRQTLQELLADRAKANDNG